MGTPFSMIDLPQGETLVPMSTAFCMGCGENILESECLLIDTSVESAMWDEVVWDHVSATGAGNCSPGKSERRRRHEASMTPGASPKRCSPRWRDTGACSSPHSDTPAHIYLARALASDGRVDFPTVTEICERSCGDALQTAAVVKMIADALDRGEDKDDLRRQLKAITVAHEMLHDALARQVMFEEPGLVNALRHIRCSQASQTGPAAESVRLLATEVVQRLVCELCLC